jgi:hypothetical protein
MDRVLNPTIRIIYDWGYLAQILVHSQCLCSDGLLFMSLRTNPTTCFLSSDARILRHPMTRTSIVRYVRIRDLVSDIVHMKPMQLLIGSASLPSSQSWFTIAHHRWVAFKASECFAHLSSYSSEKSLRRFISLRDIALSSASCN